MRGGEVRRRVSEGKGKVEMRGNTALGNTHSTTDGNVETEQLLVLVKNGDVTEVMAVDVDVVARRNGDGDLELARKVVLAVKRLVVDDGLTGNLLLVEPNLGVGGGLRLETVGELLGEVEDLVVELAQIGNDGAHLEAGNRVSARRKTWEENKGNARQCG
jgi:hypothetical protein